VLQILINLARKILKKIVHILSVCICMIALTGCSVSPATPSSTLTPSPAPSPTYTPTHIPPPVHPNIIFILTDDMTLSDLQYMPKTEELLGKGGMTFSQFFIGLTLCCPSRSCILLGEYPHNSQITGNNPPAGGFTKFHNLGLEYYAFPVWLQQVGYRTALFGKYLNGYPGDVEPTYVPPGWSEWYSPVKDDAYAEFNYTVNQNGQLLQYGNAPEDYGTDVISRLASDFIGRSVQSSAPFFAYVSVFAPHLPATPAPRHQDLFQDLALPKSPSFNEAETSDKPKYIRSNVLLTQHQIDRMETIYRDRVRSLQAVDEMVANIVAQLDQLGQLNNTYIFFTSDNGYHMGEHRLPQGKGTAYEEDIHVPLLVLGPDIQPGSTVNAITGNIDLAPTFAELAGIGSPSFVDGRSLVKFLRGQPVDQWRGGFLLERGSLGEAVSNNFSGTPLPPGFEQPDSTFDEETFPNYVGLRTADYTYLEYATGEIELYDLHADPFELENIASRANPALLVTLHNWLEALRMCAGESCRSADIQP